MGYRPNPLVSALMTNLRSNKGYRQKPTLAFVSAFPIEEWSRNVPTFRRMLTGVTERTEQLGYALETFWLGEPGMTPKRLSGIPETPKVVFIEGKWVDGTSVRKPKKRLREA